MAAQDIVDLLLEEHQDFRRLFTELETTEPEFRDDLFHYVVARLASHEAAEESVVHPTLRDTVPGGQPIAEEVLEEEASAERLLADMADMDATSDEFAAKLRTLRDEVLSHAEHEERDVFPRIREHVEPQRRAEMAEAFTKLKESGPTRPHPNTPQKPEVRAAVGPIAGAFDRARDKAREIFNR